MAERKHTPGPWGLEHQDPPKGWGNHRYHFVTRPRTDADRDVLVNPSIAAVFNFDSEREIALANARLIAAAPEMYDALMKWRFFIEEGRSDDEDALFDFIAGLTARIDGDPAEGGAKP